MPISLKLTVHDDYLEAEFDGSRDTVDELGETLEIWSEIPLVCEKHGLTKILAISKLDRRLKLDNTFVLTDKMNDIGFKPHYKLSGVIHDEKLHLEYEVMATFIRNFGFQCEIFTTEKEAKKWLLDF